jgi:hypothetical protein
VSPGRFAAPHGARSKGNPVKIRDCPAAVRENERRHRHWGCLIPGKRRLIGDWRFCARMARPRDAPTRSSRVRRPAAFRPRHDARTMHEGSPSREDGVFGGPTRRRRAPVPLMALPRSPGGRASWRCDFGAGDEISTDGGEANRGAAAERFRSFFEFRAPWITRLPHSSR